MKKSTFAVFFGNRGFFPASLIAGARQEMQTHPECPRARGADAG